MLKALKQLGPIVAQSFMARLEALEVESRGWRDWKKTWWRDSVVETLAAVRGQ